MSCYGSENGHIQLSKAGYQKIMSTTRTMHNEYMDLLFTRAINAHAVLSKLRTLKEKVSAANKLMIYRGHDTGYYFNGLYVTGEMSSGIIDELFRGAKGALCKPRKSFFAKLTNKDRSFTIDCSDEGEMSFNDERCSLIWSVEENNRSVEQAHNSHMASKIFGYLGKYAWKRGEGGVFYQQDEYSRDAAREHGDSAESVSNHFGPVGKKHQENSWKAYR
jgi:hypothetical protein